MALEDHVGRAVEGVEVVYLDCLVVGAGEQMAAVREPDLAAGFDGDVLVRADGLAIDVHHPNLVGETDDDVEPAWVDCDAVRLLVELRDYLHLPCGIVPDPHGLVHPARRNDRLAETNVQASDAAVVEAGH
jgi:hypothetical protein